LHECEHFGFVQMPCPGDRVAPLRVQRDRAVSGLAGVGAQPALPQPNPSLIPTLNIAPAVGWPHGGTPVAAPGTTVVAFADGLEHPRWLYVLPNGDVLVAETNAPPKPEDGKGIKGFVMKRAMTRAGATVPSANRITLLRDGDGDGVAETRAVFLDGLHSPFGMVLVGHDFYVANSDAIVRFPYTGGETQITAPGAKVVDLPAGPLNHHWTKNVIASQDRSRLYVTVGSNSNVAEHGMDEEEGRAAVWEVDPKTGAHRVYAFGLRNPNGLAWEPHTSKLWTAVNERDEIGSDLVPDYMTSLVDGGFTGGPTVTTANTSTSACSRRGPISSQRRSHLTTHSGRTPLRSASVSPRRARSQPHSAKARSSVSTDPGTASRSPATR
jgi:glucose/arabinose dehydrogenase